jgi:hypothetical protein
LVTNNAILNISLLLEVELNIIGILHWLRWNLRILFLGGLFLNTLLGRGRCDFTHLFIILGHLDFLWLL